MGSCKKIGKPLFVFLISNNGLRRFFKISRKNGKSVKIHLFLSSFCKKSGTLKSKYTDIIYLCQRELFYLIQ